jgi:hypothetical protein
LVLWTVLNAGIVAFSLVHQGGTVSASMFLSSQLRTLPNSVTQVCCADAC